MLPVQCLLTSVNFLVYIHVLLYLQSLESRNHVLLVFIILVSTSFLEEKKQKQMLNKYLWSATENVLNNANMIRSCVKFCKYSLHFGLDPSD